jgi:membrane protease YdiL (CAAX protease family)
MLSPKPWKADAIVRLVVSVFVCMLAGSLVTNLLHAAAGGKTGWKLILLTVAAFGFLGATLVLLRQGWTMDNLVRRAVILLSCCYAGFFLSAGAEHLTGPMPAVASPTQILIGVLSFQGAGLVLVYLFTREHHVRWPEGFGFKHRWRYALLLGLMLACLYLPIAEGLQWVSMVLMKHLPWLHLKPEEQQAVQVIRNAGTLGERLLLGVVTVLVAPVTEELLFRGILYPWGKQLGYPRLAFWGTALLFAVVHGNLAIFLPLFVLAVALTLLYEVTGNLLAPIAAHSLFNGWNLLKLYLAEGGSFLFEIIVLMVILIVTLLLAFSVRREERNG